MTRHTSVSIGTLLGLLLLQVPALAQSGAQQAASEARIQAGPVALTPSLALRDIGFDTNVFNADLEPTRDFTATFGPAVDTWLRVGRLWVSSKSLAEWVYFQDSASQRSVNLTQETRLDLDLGYVIPHVSSEYERTRRRPTLEIDARVRQTRVGAAAGLEFQLGASTAIDLEAREVTLDFGDEGFGDASLAEALNRKSRQFGFALRYQATPLTTLVFAADVKRDAFEFDSLRDSESITIAPGLEFEPLALVSGKASVGVRQFDVRDERVPDFTGVVADVDIAYTVRDVVRLTVRTARDVEYSFEFFEPYYVSTGGELEVTKVVGLNWDVVGRAGRTVLSYEVTGAGVDAGRSAGRRDVIDAWGVGVGRHVGEDVRVGFNLEYVERRSDRAGRSYSGMRTGASLTYGF